MSFDRNQFPDKNKKQERYPDNEMVNSCVLFAMGLGVRALGDKSGSLDDYFEAYCDHHKVGPGGRSVECAYAEHFNAPSSGYKAAKVAGQSFLASTLHLATGGALAQVRDGFHLTYVSSVSSQMTWLEQRLVDGTCLATVSLSQTSQASHTVGVGHDERGFYWYDTIPLNPGAAGPAALPSSVRDLLTVLHRPDGSPALGFHDGFLIEPIS